MNVHWTTDDLAMILGVVMSGFAFQLLLNSEPPTSQALGESKVD